MEEKIINLAKKIVNDSLEIKENEKVLISSKCQNANTLILKIIEEINKKNAISQVEIINEKIDVKTKQTKNINKNELIYSKNRFMLDTYDAFIYIRQTINPYENKTINENIEYDDRINDIKNKIIYEKKWILLSYPNDYDAYRLKISCEEMNNYAFDVMTMDYKIMEQNIKLLKNILDKTNVIRIIGPDTDISFSIKQGISEICVGKNNLPDGRIYTYPIESSINGKIKFNTSFIHNYIEYKDVMLDFKDGKIINSKSSINDEEFYNIINNKEYKYNFLEFGFGLNNNIKEPLGDPIYDKKIKGSIHFTLKNNKYQINGLDLIQIQSIENGGGRIYFDNVLIRENGKFVLSELENLN